MTIKADDMKESSLSTPNEPGKVGTTSSKKIDQKKNLIMHKSSRCSLPTGKNCSKSTMETRDSVQGSYYNLVLFC